MGDVLFWAMDAGPPRVLSDQEETSLLDATKEPYGHRRRALIVVALRAGGRRSELLTLGWQDIHLGGDDPYVVFTQTKGHRDRRVPISPDVVSALRRLQAATIVAGGPFIGMGNNLGRSWGRIRKRAKVTDVSIDDLRRTFVTRLIRAGVSLPTVQKLAGHADIKTTLRYYHSTDDADLCAGIAKLDQAVG